MALSEPQIADEISDDQEANELFNTFMDITKDAAIMEHQPNNPTAGEQGRLQSNIDDAVEEEETVMKAKESEKKPVELENENEKEKDLPDEAKGGVRKSLTRAVNELSDLEKQLSLMISAGPNTSIQQGNASSTSEDGTFIETSEGEVIISVNEEKSHDVRESDIKSTESTDRETAWGDEDADKKADAEITTEFKDEDEKEISGEKNITKVDEAKDVKAEEDTEISTKTNKDDIKESVSEYSHEEDASKPKPSEDVESNVVDFGGKLDENVESGNIPNGGTPVDHTASEKEDVDKKNDNAEIPETKVQEGSNAIEEGSKETSSEAQDGGTNRKSFSGAEIEILMTDVESGISERKSLDSLDSLDDNHGRPDSPVLSDEGIDSDSKSDVGDDDTFDISSSDFSMKSKTSLLDVDRNRTGSDSSTLSEQEFKRDLSDKTDGFNVEASDHITMKGYLLKLGGSGLTPRNWRRRWFVLKGDNCLYYYKHSKDKVPCGVIVLCNYSITKAPEYSKKCCFKLNKGGARSYHLCASNDDEMRKWMVPLMAAANEVAPDGSSFQISEGNVHNVSIPALSIKDPECHGYLSKQGHNIKNWKRRYCVLKNGYLYYYSDMSNTTALGVAKLLGYSIKMGEKRGKHYCFYGSPPDESLRTYHFAAETENDRERWMTRMSESIRKGNTPNHVTSE